MKAAIVRGPGQAPVYGDFEPPVAREGEVLIHVAASALSHLTRNRASGSHYSSSGKFPFVSGADGVGRLDDGRRVFFLAPRTPFGGMAEQTVVPLAQCLPLPSALDNVNAAVIANPGMSSWAALSERAKLARGETVLINGATGIAGRLAVQIAKHLGAGKVIATGRNVEALRELPSLGADATITLANDVGALEQAFAPHFAQGVDVVLDYLWGASAERLLIAAAKVLPEGKPMRFVQVGGASGADVTLPSAVLRSSAIVLMGSGIGSVGLDRLIVTIAAVLDAAVAVGFKVAARAVPLSQIETAWNAETANARIVFTV
jgi:NADPH:quinone reductase-like Zn-dependent oxidoreductase